MKTTLKDKMLDYRASNNLSQTELAERCGVSLQTIWSIENGKQKPNRLTERKIKNIIGD